MVLISTLSIMLSHLIHSQKNCVYLWTSISTNGSHSISNICAVLPMSESKFVSSILKLTSSLSNSSHVSYFRILLTIFK